MGTEPRKSTTKSENRVCIDIGSRSKSYSELNQKGLYQNERERKRETMESVQYFSSSPIDPGSVQYFSSSPIDPGIVISFSLLVGLIPLALLALILYLLFQIRHSSQDLAYEMRDARVALERAMDRLTDNRSQSATGGGGPSPPG